MKCPKCASENVSVQFMEAGAKTKKSTVGLGGHAYNAARGVAAISTLGLSNIFLPKATGKSKTKIQNDKVAICQDCGNSWNVK